MKILFTGASSFTGMWFARALASAGHDVVATFRKRPEAYDDELRRKRVTAVLQVCTGLFDCSFGDAAFVAAVASQGFDLLCHHAADVTNYKSPEFDVSSALANNTRNVTTVLTAFGAHNKSQPRLLLTGSAFENDEGAGSESLPAFSPYGLSKSFTYEVFRHEAARAGIPLGKFVIPNPFGPYEDPRFTSYLMKTWFAGRSAAVNTPAYVRDNIHVSLLSSVYTKFAAEFAGNTSIHPSGYPESQGAFAMRFAHEMRPRLNMRCELELKQQVAFAEPRVRINTDVIDSGTIGWDEARAWDELADYYKTLFAPN